MPTKVHIEFQRVQTWIFAIPRLRTMVGANTLLGEVLRKERKNLALQTASWTLEPQPTAGYPGADPQDPVRQIDNPAEDAAQGIVSRDGGHFEAVFSTGAEIFSQAAESLLQTRLPGLRFSISIDGVENSRAHSNLSIELPIFAPCQWSGRGIASLHVQQGNEVAHVALEVSRRHEAAVSAEKEDLASLVTCGTPLGRLPRPDTLEALADAGYLCVIHADGNRVGAARPKDQDSAAVAKFFHRNRVLLRRALVSAINHACVGATDAPLVPLMLGGDDLLVICRPPVALPFIVTLCNELERLQGDGSPYRLTLGIGAVFSKYTVPFSRLHEVAENLAASAKRHFVQQNPLSLVDWAVYTTAWLDDPTAVRWRDWIRGTEGRERILSRRPLPVLGSGLVCLEGLVKNSAALAKAPRSQLRYLVDQLPRGRRLSELAYRELSPEARQGLDDAGLGSNLWEQPDGDGPWVTSLLDLVEIAEIGRLGRTRTSHRRDAVTEIDYAQSGSHA